MMSKACASAASLKRLVLLVWVLVGCRALRHGHSALVVVHVVSGRSAETG